MKAVIYHADSLFAWGAKPAEGYYERLFHDAKKDFAKHGITTVHLTLKGFPGWGDECYHYEGLQKREVVYNREVCFTKFLRDAPEDVYWFTEPDCRILEMFPPLEGDASFLYRQGDDVAMCPAWRLVTKKALPIFEEVLELFKDEPRRDWHGDSDVFTAMWRRMGSPTDRTTYKGIEVTMRPYRDYIKGKPRYTINHLGPNKLKTLG